MAITAVPDFVSHRNFVISAADAVVLHVAAEATQVNTLVQEHCKPLHAVACHPAQPVICMGSYCGVLKVWDYQCKKYICSRIFEKENEISCLTYDPKGTSCRFQSKVV